VSPKPQEKQGVLNRAMCGYCGQRVATDREHVFPRNLYPESKANSRVQRLTIPSCNICNNRSSDDEAHFRNILVLAGEPNKNCQELWETTVQRSFRQPDASRRIKDIDNVLRPVEVDGQARHKVYPGEDARVVRIINKVIRGLSHYHNVLSPMSESRVWVDVMRYPVPDEFLSEMMHAHREPDIAEYRYSIIEDFGIQSGWLITFFERITFLGIISTEEGGLFGG
jgi:hypothetical protein